MKKTIVALFVIANMMYFSSNALADQRFENWQGICHFAYDVNDDDNEVYYANCVNRIKTHDYGDGQGRLAYGSSTVKEAWYPESLSTYGRAVKLKGSQANEGRNLEHTVAADIPCVMVTSNYNADADDNNETVYVTDDWVLTSEWAFDTTTMTGTLTHHLDCFRGVAQ